MASKYRKYCIAYGCLSTSQIEGVSFFTVPQNMDRCKEWLQKVGRRDLLERKGLKPKSYLVCSKHFDDSSFKYVKLLKNDAVPTNFLMDPNMAGSELHKDKTLHSEPSETMTEVSKVKTWNIGTQTSNPDKKQTKKRVKKIVLSETSKRRRSHHLFHKVMLETEADDGPSTSKNPNDDLAKRFRKLLDWMTKIQDEVKGKESRYKSFSLYLHYYSPQAYSCLQTVLKLPKACDLNRINLNIPPILQNRVLNSLRLKIKSLPEIAKYCTICVDEMPLKQKLYYDTRGDEVIGFHNINGKVLPEIANRAYVIMLQGIRFKWSQPVAYAFTAGTAHFDIWISEVLSKLTALGISIKAFIFKQGSNFDRYAKDTKNFTIQKPYFEYNDTKIYYIFDVPDLMISLRNYLLKCDFHYEDDVIVSIDHIKALYLKDKRKKISLMPKITDAHMDPNKNEIKYAIELFSRNVSCALHTYIDLGVLTEDVRPTAEFFQTVNHLFDTLNSNKLRSALKMTKDQETILKNAKKLFAAIEALNKKENDVQMKTFTNFQITIGAITMLYKDLLEEEFPHLLTRRLNLECIESFFETIKLHNGCLQDPTPIQFRRAFSKLFSRFLMKKIPNENHGLDICDMLEKAEEVLVYTFSHVAETTPVSRVGLNGESDYCIEWPKKNPLTYVSSYLLYKCSAKHMCPCLQTLFKSSSNLNDHKVLEHESYNKNAEFYGKLILPPHDFIKYIQKLEEAFAHNFNKALGERPGSQLFDIFKIIPSSTPCNCFPVEYLLQLFIRLRIYATIKFNNSVLKVKKCAKKQV